MVIEFCLGLVNSVDFVLLFSFVYMVCIFGTCSCCRCAVCADCLVDGVSCLCEYIVACCFGLIGLLTVRGCCRLRLVCCDCLCFLVFARLFVLGVCDGCVCGWVSLGGYVLV